MSDGHDRLDDVVLDVDAPELASALETVFAPHRTHRHRADTVGAATRVAADLAADVVVIAPTADGAHGDGGDSDGLHDRLALRPRRWALAAEVVGARLVLVSSDDVFDPRSCPAEGCDEFRAPDAVDPVGRSRRAGEAQVLTADHLASRHVVRVGPDDDPASVARLVRWAAGAVAGGTWHLPGSTSKRLDARHTRLVRGETSGGAAGAGQ